MRHRTDITRGVTGFYSWECLTCGAYHREIQGGFSAAMEEAAEHERTGNEVVQ